MTQGNRHCVLAIFVFGLLCFFLADEVLASIELKLVAEFDDKYLYYESEPILLSECVFLDDSTMLIFDTQSRVIYTLSPNDAPRIYRTFEELEIQENAQISGAWTGQNKLYIGISGREPSLLEYNLLEENSRQLDIGIQVTDLDLWDDGAVAVQAPPASATPVAKVMIYQSNFEEITQWGEMCPSEFDQLEPFLRLGCMNRIALDSRGNAYIASQNTGRCEKLSLNNLATTEIRKEEPQWTTPTASGSNKIFTSLVLFDIAVTKTNNFLFLLASPKGLHGEHALEIYQGDVLVDVVYLGSSFGSVICGPNNSLALMASSPRRHVSLYQIEVSP